MSSPERPQAAWSTLFGFVVAALLVVLTSLPSLGLRLVADGDWLDQLGRIAQFRAAMEDLQFPPAVAPGDYAGWGSPSFLFEPHAFMLVGALWSWALGDIVAAGALAVVVFAAFSVWSAYFAGRELGASPVASMLAAAAFVLHPGLLHLRHVSGEYSAYAAWSAAPLVVAGVAAAARPGLRGPLIMAAGIAIASSAHLIVGASVVLLGVALALVVPGLSPRSRLGALAGTAAGLSISSYYWLPAIVLGPQVNLWSRAVDRFDAASAPATTTLGVVLLVALALMAGVAAWRTRGLGRGIATVLLLVSMGATLAVVDTTWTMWRTFPLQGFTETPHVLLGVLALTSSAAVALIATTLSPQRGVLWFAVAGVLIGAAAAPGLLRWRGMDADEAAHARERASGESLDGAMFVQRGDPHLPVWADAAAWRTNDNRDSPILRVHGRGGATEFGAGATELSLMVDSPDGVTIEFARYAFSDWVAATDLGRLKSEIGPGGALSVDVPAGFYELWLEYRPPRVRRWTSGWSALCAVLWLVLLEVHLQRARRESKALHG